MCSMLVRSCSRMNCLMRKVPAVNGRSAVLLLLLLQNSFIDMSVTNHAQIFEGVYVGELRAVIKERGQIAGVRVGQITSDFCVLTVRDFLHAHPRSLFDMVCM